jgi:hypothetical protein
MANFHHKAIKRFGLDGEIYDDSAIPRLKIEYIRLLVWEMRISGYVPRLDIDPDFTISYNEKTENFDFVLSIYGTYTGRKQSKWIAGIDGSKVIATHQNKLDESSQAQESKSNQK